MTGQRPKARRIQYSMSHYIGTIKSTGEQSFAEVNEIIRTEIQDQNEMSD